MGCCGKIRQALPAENNQNRPVTYTLPAPTFHYFEYTGKTALTAIGVATGTRYRFASPGTQVAIDSRDAPSMTAVPNLRRTKSVE
jgi:YD repeat-containing protein